MHFSSAVEQSALRTQIRKPKRRNTTATVAPTTQFFPITLSRTRSGSSSRHLLKSSPTTSLSTSDADTDILSQHSSTSTRLMLMCLSCNSTQSPAVDEDAFASALSNEAHMCYECFARFQKRERRYRQPSTLTSFPALLEAENARVVGAAAEQNNRDDGASYTYGWSSLRAVAGFLDMFRCVKKDGDNVVYSDGRLSFTETDRASVASTDAVKSVYYGSE